MKHGELKTALYITGIFFGGMTCGREIELCGYYPKGQPGEGWLIIVTAVISAFVAIVLVKDRKR